tara:strand:- start:2992 stop:3183 length:192 start_codon:yes stop_codon:yes gene_type:complete
MTQMKYTPEHPLIRLIHPLSPNHNRFRLNGPGPDPDPEPVPYPCVHLVEKGGAGLKDREFRVE